VPRHDPCSRSSALAADHAKVSTPRPQPVDILSVHRLGPRLAMREVRQPGGRLSREAVSAANLAPLYRRVDKGCIKRTGPASRPVRSAITATATLECGGPTVPARTSPRQRPRTRSPLWQRY